MKNQILILMVFTPFFIFCQETISMENAEGRVEMSMNEVSGKTTKGLYRYYAKGNQKPFTGILYAKYPNGKFSSWQEYVDGVGQGKWINYYENGNFKEIGHYEQNKVEGSIQKFHSNGQLKAIGKYKDWRIKIEEWKYYNETGNLILTKNYGKKGSISEVEEYHKRGEISDAWYQQIMSKNGF